MPVVVTSPQTGEPFGPGFLVSAATDSIGPWPSGTYWQIDLTDSDGVNIIASKRILTNAGFITEIMLNQPLGSPAIRSQPPATDTLDGDPSRLRVIFVPVGSATQTTDVVGVLDRKQGQVQELAAIIQGQSSAAPTLTEEEHNAVLQTNVGVIAMAGINPLDLVGDLAAAIGSSAPLAFGSLGDLLGPLTGDGTLTAPPALHVAFGVYWVATTIPDGLGHRHGQSEEYPARLVQWRTTHVVGAIEMTTEVVDAITHRELWRFRQQTPHAVQYSVLPGVEVFARYWLFP